MIQDLKFNLRTNTTQKKCYLKNIPLTALQFKHVINKKQTQLVTPASQATASQSQRSLDALQISSSNYDLHKASHPTACIFTFLFKLSALIMYCHFIIFVNYRYLLMGVLFNNITIFILVVLLTAVDFWTTKNVTGRLLVGLRWTSLYQDDGTEVWTFESHEIGRDPNSVDTAFFWSSQVIASSVWGLFLFINLLGFNVYWSCLNAIVLCLTGTNLYGFYKCRGGNNLYRCNEIEHQKKMLGLKDNLTKKGMQFIGNMMMKQQFGSQNPEIV